MQRPADFTRHPASPLKGRGALAIPLTRVLGTRIVLMWVVPICLLSQLAAQFAAGQTAEDQSIDAIRKLDTISPNDHQRIAEWVELQVKQLAGQAASAAENERLGEFAKFRQKFKGQYENKDNTPQFKTQLATQTAAVAANHLSNPKVDRIVALSLARALLDMNRIETLPGLLAGLKSSEPAARMFSARALAQLKTAIAAEKDKLDPVIAALREAGSKEMNPLVVEQIYAALALPAQPAAVFDAYMATVDKRVAARKQSAVADGAEATAFEFFRNPAVINALNAEQKSQLSKAVATLLRLNAERYNNANVSAEEGERIERELDGGEEIAALLAPGKGGKIREALASANRADVLTQTYLWIGNSKTNEAGALNAAPLNVPIGAP